MSRAEVDRALAGDTSAVARLLSKIEQRGGLDPELMDELFKRTGHASVIGITGPPGAGKSTLVDALVGTVRSSGSTAAVLAVDPSSPLTGGAVLGDRVRMHHATDPGVFVRSMASRGHVGGLALATPAALRLLDAAGTDVIFVETVGVGQNEVEIAEVADCVVLVLGPLGGDDVQAMKAGVIEIADILVINKSDLPGATEMRAHVARALRTGRSDSRRVPDVLLTAAMSGVGVEQLLSAIHERLDDERGSGRLATRELERLRREVVERAAWSARERVLAVAEGLIDDEITGQLARRERDPATIAELIVDRLFPDQRGSV